MGKHHQHAWQSIFHSQSFPAARGDHGRQLADSNSHRTIEPDRDGADGLSDEERHLRQSAHTDREPADDFHLAAQHAGQSEAEPATAGTRGDQPQQAER